MRVRFHKKFKKAMAKQPRFIQTKFKEIFKIFEQDQFDPSLHNHALYGKFLNTRSFDITGNVRVHYEETNDGVILKNIGTHAQLYG